MPNKNRRKSSFEEEEDVYDLREKGLKKTKKRSKRHFEKQLLDDLKSGFIDSEDYQDFIETNG